MRLGTTGYARVIDGVSRARDVERQSRILMKLPTPCGPVSRLMDGLVRGDGSRVSTVALGDRPVVSDRDVQLALWTAYELAYRGFEDVDAGREWDLSVLALRAAIETRFEDELRSATRDMTEQVPDEGSVGDQLLGFIEADDGPHLSAYLRRDATADQMREFLRERSVQQLKESDPQSFLLPRLEGAAKVALAEIQYDEYGAGRVDRLHQSLYARAMEAVGLDPEYGAYIDDVSAVSLANANVMSLFSLNRRLLGAGVGHFAAFEASSPVPSRRIAAGVERLGLGEVAAAYFLEHVEADSIHEQVAARDLCGSFVADDPSRRPDVIFGAACALYLDALSAEDLLARWSSDPVAREQAS
jgi:pyrroloquinoline quinone (PQQ) biosynthesis protein C